MEEPTQSFRKLFLFSLTTTFLLQSVTAQTTRPDQTQPTQYATFTPSVAVIIIVLITALFFLGFFSIYIRHCSDNSISAARGGTVRPLAGGRSRRNLARGLDASLIETLPTFAYSEVKHLKIGKGALECAVCLNEFEDDETLRLLPKCDHVFHPECIDEWLSSHTTCPVCRANLAETDTADEGVMSDAVTVETVGVTDRGSVTIEVAEEVVADDGGTVNRSGPLRSRSIKSMIWSKFPRSHSAGHSLVQPGENVDRFTLKLPDQIRQEIMTRALNRTTSLVVLPRETSSRRGYRAAAVNSGGGVGEGSSRGKSYRRLGSLDRPDRWMFTMAPPFLARESSMKKSNRSAIGSDGTSASKRFNLIGRLSFNRFGGSKRSEPGLIMMGNKSSNNNNNNESSSLPV